MASPVAPRGSFRSRPGALLVVALLAASGAVQALPLVVKDVPGALPPGAAASRTDPLSAPPSVEGPIAAPLRLPHVPLWLPRAAADDDNHVATINFTCPKPSTRNVPDATDDHYSVWGCPVRLYDVPWSFGSPAIAVQRDDPRQMAVFALHGDHTADGPTNRSRGGLQLTTFTSANQGISWEDQPTSQGFGAGEFGEWATGVMDSLGQMYIGYIFSTKRGTEQPESGVVLFKAGTVLDPRTVFEAYGDPYLVPTAPGSWIAQVNLLAIPARDPKAEDGELADPENGTTDPPPRDGDAAVSEIPTPERIVAVWHEKADNTVPREWQPNWTGWIDARWTHTGTEHDWLPLPYDQRIGPCADASNPVAYKGKVYVACVVARGYDHRARAHIGDIDMWEIDLTTGNTTQVAHTGARGGHPQLAATKDGYMVMVRSWFEDGEFHAYLSTGWYGDTNWDPYNDDLGANLRAIAQGAEIRDAHVTAHVILEDDPVVFLVYQQWRNSTVDPNRLDPLNPPILDDYSKIVVMLDSCTSEIMAAVNLNLGTGMDPYHVQNYQINPGGFNDIQDGLQVVREEGTQQEVVYFGIADYGALQYGAMYAAGRGTGCVLVPPLPYEPVTIAALPQALTISNPANLLVGSTVGAVALAMVGYLLTVKRRSAVWSPTEGR